MRDTIDMAREAGILGEFDTAQDIIECGIEVWLSGERGVQTLERFAALVRADERERAKHNEEVLMNALWKACGDDEQLVEATIESQGELR